MRGLIARHPFFFCATLFAVTMLALHQFAKAAVSVYGVWSAFAIVGTFLAIGAIIDRKDRQRD